MEGGLQVRDGDGVAMMSCCTCLVPPRYFFVTVLILSPYHLISPSHLLLIILIVVTGLHMKNMVFSDNKHLREEKEKRWQQLDGTVKNNIRAMLWQALMSPVQDARKSAAQAVAAYAGELI